MGVERLVLLLEELQLVPQSVRQRIDVYVIGMGDDNLATAMTVAETLRHDAGLRVQLHCGGGGFKSQMKKADKSGADFAILIGDDERAASEVSLKPLRGNGEQIRVTQDSLVSELKGKFSL
jgi:histidyl-tRNA synthetase